MSEEEIRKAMADAGAVLTDGHFIYTKGGHGKTYVNMRLLGHRAGLLDEIGRELGASIGEHQLCPDLIIGPETMGRTLAQTTAAWLGIDAIWCSIVEVDGVKKAVFDEKFDFGRLVAGKRFVIVDELLNTGGSILLVIDLIREFGGEVIGIAVAVSRSPQITHETFGVPVLMVLVTVYGLEVFMQDDCVETGPCSNRIPVNERPGHGHEWKLKHPDYPTVP